MWKRPGLLVNTSVGYGNELKFLVTRGKEWQPTEPAFPNPNEDDYEKKKAIWSKDYDSWKKCLEEYQVQKGKVFNIILGRCDKAMLNRLESHKKFEAWEESSDVTALLAFVKECMYGGHFLKYPPMQAVRALKSLVLARQDENEDAVQFYERFCGLVEAAKVYFEIVEKEFSGTVWAIKASQKLQFLKDIGAIRK